MYLVVWVRGTPISALTVNMVDYFKAHETLEAAERHYNNLVSLDSTYSASICSIVRSTDYQPTEIKPS